MTALICSKCGRTLELMLRGNIVDLLLDQWIGNFCSGVKASIASIAKRHSLPPSTAPIAPGSPCLPRGKY